MQGTPARELRRLAELLGEHNSVARQISDLVQRQCQISHVGEHIASRVFDIELEESATARAIDGGSQAARAAR